MDQLGFVAFGNTWPFIIKNHQIDSLSHIVVGHPNPNRVPEISSETLYCGPPPLHPISAVQSIRSEHNRASERFPLITSLRFDRWSRSIIVTWSEIHVDDDGLVVSFCLFNLKSNASEEKRVKVIIEGGGGLCPVNHALTESCARRWIVDTHAHRASNSLLDYCTRERERLI